MKITNRELMRTAGLAALHLSEEEMEGARSDLEKMLDLAEGMHSIDTKDCASFDIPPLPVSALREDVVQNGSGKAAALKNAPYANEDGFIVPKTIAME
ncbi:MAG: Asp-tRNA(Asn)/Glu-tRNA(Gln) amidotransferase subunit GatC [Lachnospiraceae bacterium]|nr:Asp-tRNA(Asn)/Glu-tRNA(Gln) amidotransferase subunit GatC [Lachnospiraceae bacterium]